MDLVGKIIDYEMGNMSQQEMIGLFQQLVDSGQAWTLQGHYGRTARALIDAGYITHHRKGGGNGKEEEN